MNIHIFCSPEEAMIDNWQKLDFNTKYFLFSEKSELSSTENITFLCLHFLQNFVFSACIFLFNFFFHGVSHLYSTIEVEGWSDGI